jgi:hypothetical protein
MCITNRRLGRAVTPAKKSTVQTALYPPTGSLRVLPPCVAKGLHELALFAPDHEIYQRQVQNSECKATWRAKDQRRTQKINRFPPRYRGFLENLYGPVVMRCFCACSTITSMPRT